MFRAVVENLIVDLDDSAIGRDQSRNHIDDRAFSGTGRAVQTGDAAVALKRNVEFELAELFRDVDAEHLKARAAV